MQSFQINGHTPTILTLTLQDPTPAWLPRVSTGFNNLAAYISFARTLEDAWTLIETENPDAVIAPADCQNTFKLYNGLCNQMDAFERPLLIAVGAVLPESAAEHQKDIFLLPPDIEHFEFQVINLIRLHSTNKQLQHANHLLAQENHHLKTMAEFQRQHFDEMNLLKNAIVRNVSHELKTPLLQVKSAVALLAEDGENTSTLIEYAMGATARLEAAVRNITLLNELLNDSQDAYTLGPVLVNEAIQYALRNLRRSWEHKDSIERIEVHLEAGLPPVLADRQALGIVMQLLIDNALKFSQQNVEVLGQRQDDWVLIAVKDYGIGIAPDKIERIFDSFYQIDNSTTRRYGGLGVGLAIVRFILERHKTRIEVKSQEGKGSSFSFRLPIAQIGRFR
ncbi:MAG: sensor histidine kinase [Chloroflexi bacterium]|nr:sensor histidine kinase [Chloroflexota bacterium]MDL1882483.1 HAMP domain-containing histidine kinase [Anaerolineae bacterium CFX8]